jgi:hypothetical protein
MIAYLVMRSLLKPWFILEDFDNCEKFVSGVVGLDIQRIKKNAKGTYKIATKGKQNIKTVVTAECTVRSRWSVLKPTSNHDIKFNKGYDDDYVVQVGEPSHTRHNPWYLDCIVCNTLSYVMHSCIKGVQTRVGGQNEA